MGFTKIQQKDYFSTAAATSHTVTYTSTPVQNHLLIAAVSSDGVITTPTGWTKITIGIQYTDTEIYYKIAGASESTSIVLAINANTSLCACALEYSGNVTASPLDKSAANVQSGTIGATTWATGTTAATTLADELCIAVWGQETATGQSPTYTGGFTQLQAGDTTGAGTNCSQYVAFLETSSTGTQTCTITVASNQAHWAAGIACFKSATTFTKTLSVTGVGAVSLTKQPSKSQVVATSGAVSVVKQPSKPQTVTGSGVVSATKSVQKPQVVNSAGVASLVKQAAKPQAVAGVGLASVAKQAQKPQAVAEVGAVALAKIAAKPQAVAEIGAVSVAKQVAKVQAVTGAGVVSDTKVATKPQTVTGLGLVSLTKFDARAPLAVASTGVVTLTKQAQKPQAVAETGAVSLSSVVVPAPTGSVKHRMLVGVGL